ncbi:MAG: IS200/IS605 family element transposase accessory protein TnpB, partial [Archaeoglobus sp.]|uniref:RNA-guided endonuclease InsQ/TnpB family protein n=1 Tax=Archaeoglobus sp. TaxID=1872626 RepID=UPI001DA205DD
MNVVIKLKFYPSKTQEELLKTITLDYLNIKKQYLHFHYLRLKQGKPLLPTKSQPRAYEEYKLEKSNFYNKKLRQDYPQYASRFLQAVEREVIQDLKSYQAKLKDYQKGRGKHKPSYPWPREKSLRFVVKNNGVKIDREKRLLTLTLSKDLKLELKFKGKFYWVGEVGKAEVRREADGHWYAYITIRNPKKPKKEKKQVKAPRKHLIAGIDLGLNNLMAIVLYDKATGELVGSILVKGRVLKAVMFKYQKLIAKIQQGLSANNQKTSRRLRKAYWRLVKTLESLSRMLVVKAFKILKALGVKELVVGDVKNIPRDRIRKVNFMLQYWSYYKLKKFIEFKSEQFGFKLKWVSEAFTSLTDPLTGEVVKSSGGECSLVTGKHLVFGRVFRGLFKSPSLGKVLNADLVSAFNVLRKVYNITPSLTQVVRVLSGGSSVVVSFQKSLGGVGVRVGGSAQALKPSLV